MNEEPWSRSLDCPPRLSSMLVGLLLLGGCATGDPVERDLAEAGVRSTRALAADVDGFARRLEDGDGMAAFVATWNGCSAGAGGPCAITEPSRVEQAQRQELATAVALRAEAVVSLHRAYVAFRRDIAQQSGAEVERAIHDALLGTANYATSVSGLPLARTAAIGRPLENAVGAVASAMAQGQRRNQTRASSAALGQAIADLREAMVLETRKYDALTEVLVRERVDAHRALLQAGLVSGSGTLRPASEWLNVPLARDADTVVARSAPARTAVEAMIEATARRDIRRTQQRYRAAISTLAELEQVHAVLDRGRRPDLSSLDQSLLELERLVDPASGPAPRSVGLSPQDPTTVGQTLR
jgi:hypothetical protein